MKYLNALLREKEIPPYPGEDEPRKTREIISAFSAGTHSRNEKEMESASWPCPHCGRPAVIESVEPSLDGERTFTFWHCDRCQTYAVTPNTIKEPPKD